jgi:hypothetical protein
MLKIEMYKRILTLLFLCCFYLQIRILLPLSTSLSKFVFLIITILYYNEEKNIEFGVY